MNEKQGHRGPSIPNPADVLWDAMNQMRDTFDDKVSPRMGRGDVRSAIIVLLAEEPMHGYQLIREIEERSGGRWKPSPGSIYPTLQMLADEGAVTVATEEDRKIYSLTEAGREEADGASAPWVSTQSTPGNIGALSKAGFELAQAVSQLARSGSKEQKEQAVEVIDSARRRIYSILAQD